MTPVDIYPMTSQEPFPYSHTLCTGCNDHCYMYCYMYMYIHLDLGARLLSLMHCNNCVYIKRIASFTLWVPRAYLYASKPNVCDTTYIQCTCINRGTINSVFEGEFKKEEEEEEYGTLTNYRKSTLFKFLPPLHQLLPRSYTRCAHF